MDNMEAIDLGELGRPKKFQRRELAETEDTNELNSVEETTDIAAETEDTNKIKSAEETTKTAVVPDGNDYFECEYPPALEAEVFIASYGVLDYVLPGLTYASDPVEEAPVPAEEAPAPAEEAPAPAEEAPADANHGLPSTSTAKPRRRPRKGIPRRAPLY